MKIAAIIENNIKVGGGFTMSVDLVRVIQDIAKKNKYDFLVFNYEKNNSEILTTLGIDHVNLKDSIFDKFFAFLNYSLLGMYFQKILKFKTNLENTLIKNNVDLTIFVTPSPKSLYLQKTNYAITVYDICHRDFPEFSEVRSFNIFKLREVLLINIIGQAVFVITESEELKDKININFDKDKNRIIAIPNGPSPFLNTEYSELDKKYFFEKNNINFPYFFYPAQFWEHKNHIRILQAVKKIVKTGKNIQFIFCGSDKGNLSFLKKKINELEINNNIKILDFVNNCELKILYKNCKAVVMPTYFGPTNIPPLDAWQCNVPLIYSKHLRAQAGDGALLVEVDSVDDLVEAINKIDNPDVVNELIVKGDNMLKNILNKRKLASSILEEKILKFEKIKETWS
jgi:glycosyltransferase involved in cell wall biosynthesis